MKNIIVKDTERRIVCCLKVVASVQVTFFFYLQTIELQVLCRDSSFNQSTFIERHRFYVYHNIEIT